MPLPSVTVGLEFETETLTARDLRGLSSFVSPTHDASIETPYTYLNLAKVACESSPRVITRGDTQVVGTEAVTVPLPLEHPEFFGYIEKLCAEIAVNGEPEEGRRSGIHIHIGVPEYSLDDLKRIIRWGLYTEALFFQIACNGYHFRGETNDAAFCRPISRCGPPCIQTKHGWFQCFEVEHLLNARTKTEFWKAYADTKPSSLTKYVPQRYTWLNLYSLLVRHTLEFRPFNKTLNPYRLMAEIELCANFVREVLGGSEPPAVVNSAFDMSKLGVIGIGAILEEFAGITGMSEQSRSTLEHIVFKSPLVAIEEIPVQTHLREYNRVWEEWPTSFVPKAVSSPKHPIVVTIHTLRGGR